MIKWVFLATAIVLEVTGSLSLKAALEAPGLYAVVAVGYLGSFTALYYALRNGMGLGVGYGIWGACGVALTAIFSALLFEEPVSLLMGIGIALIIGGVMLVELGSAAALKSREATASPSASDTAHTGSPA